MKIGVLSDTHVGSVAEIPAEALASLRGVDMILHAGDILELGVLEELRAIAPVHAVWGNMDPAPTREGLPPKTTVVADGKRIGLIHGSGPPFGLDRRVLVQFEDVDAIVFGHSHRPMSEVLDGVLMFNPGSPTDYRFAPYRSLGILHVEGGEMLGTIVRLD